MRVERTIPYPPYYDLSDGAAKNLSKPNICNTPYYTHLDFFEMHSTNTLTILSHFRTYQQTTEVTCGPCVALMLLYYFCGGSPYDELQIAAMMHTNCDLDGDNIEEPGVANEEGEYGTSTDRLASFFVSIGWRVQSSLTCADKDGVTFQTSEQFKDWVLFYLKLGIPIMVEWIDWGGHWQIIIGYDTMGTEDMSDDVLIFADSYDTSDHIQDGYYIFSADRFFYMWMDYLLLPKDQKIQQWVIAVP